MIKNAMFTRRKFIPLPTALCTSLLGIAPFGVQPKTAASEDEFQFSIEAKGARLLVVVRLEDQLKFQTELPEEFVLVNSSFSTNEQIVVIGELNTVGAEGVAVLSRRTGAIEAVFWCYAASASPSGDWIAFVRFYPSRFTVSPESQYRLVATRRPLLKRSREEPMDIGIPIRVGATDPLRVNVDVPSHDVHRLKSPLMWEASGRSFTFLDQHGSSLINIVHVEPSDAVVKVRTARIWDSKLLNVLKELPAERIRVEIDNGGVVQFTVLDPIIKQRDVSYKLKEVSWVVQAQ